MSSKLIIGWGLLSLLDFDTGTGSRREKKKKVIEKAVQLRTLSIDKR